MGVIRERIASEISYYLTRLPNGANQPTPHNMLEASLRSMRLWLCACVLLFDHCYFENENVCCAEIKSLKIVLFSALCAVINIGLFSALAQEIIEILSTIPRRCVKKRAEK